MVIKTAGFLALLGKREIRHNWAQFLAVIGIGGVAVTLFVGLLANAESIENRVNKAYDDGKMADLWVTTSTYKKTDLPALEKLVGEAGSVEGRFEIPGRVARNSVFCVVTPSLPTISTPYAIENTDTMPTDHFVLVDTALAHGTDEESNARFQVGKSLEVDYDISSYVNSTMINGMAPYVKEGGTNLLSLSSVKLTYTISGIMSYPENVTKASYNTSTCLVDDTTFRQAVKKVVEDNYTPEGAKILFEQANGNPLCFGDGRLDDTGVFTRPNQYLISLKNHDESAAMKEKVSAFFSAKNRNNLYSLDDRSSMAFVITMHNDVVQARQFTFLFPFVFFFVAVLVILTTISQIILKERTQIGTMKAIGISPQLIYGHYIGLACSIVGIGILLGEIIGPILVPFLLGQKYDILYTLPARTYVFPLLYGLLTALGFLAVTSLVTYLVCRKEVRLKPAESMRPAIPMIKAHESKLLPGVNNVHLLSLKMAFRNIRMDVTKSAMVVAGVMGCTALLLCGYGIEDTVYHGIDHDMALGNNADVSLTFSSPQTRATLASDLALEGVASYEPLTRARSDVSFNGGAKTNTYIYIMGNDVNSHMKVDFPLDEIALSSKAARAIGAQAGDVITFTYGATSYQNTVYQVFDAFIFNGVMIHSSNPILKSEGDLTFQGVYVDAAEGTSPAELKTKLQELSYVIEADTQADWYRQINDIMSGVLIMTNAVKTFAIVLAIIVLYNLALLNFRERIRDIATLKVLGFSKLEIADSLLWETMTLTALGVSFGLALGYPFMLAVMKLNIVDLVDYLYTMKWTSVVYSFLLTFVVAFVVNLYLSFRTGRVKMVESLKSVE